MPYVIEYSGEVVDDLRHMSSKRCAQLIDQITEQLVYEPSTVTPSKRLRPGQEIRIDWKGPVWELCLGKYLIYYDVDEATRKVLIRAIAKIRK